MKRSKLFALLAAVALVATLVLCFAVPAAAAGTYVPTTNKTVTINGSSDIAGTINDLSSSDTVKVAFRNNRTLSSGAMFGVTKKTSNPIVITSSYTYSSILYSTLTLSAGDYYCANDYVFSKIKLVANGTVNIYAGSGNVVFQDVTFEGDFNFFGDTCDVNYHSGSLTFGPGATPPASSVLAVVGSDTAPSASAKLILDGEGVCTPMESAAKAQLQILSGSYETVYGIYADSIAYNGDFDLLVSGGTVTKDLYAANAATLGSVSVNGKLTFNMTGGTVRAYHGAPKTTKGVENNLSGGTLEGYSYKNNNDKTITVPAFTALAYTTNGCLEGTELAVRNIVSGDVKITGEFYGGLAKDKTYTSNYGVRNEISGGTFSSTFVAGGDGNKGETGITLPTLENFISGGTFTSASYMGLRHGTLGSTLKNYISGGEFRSFLILGHNSATNKNVTLWFDNTITGGTFARVHGASMSKAVTGNVKNTIQGGSFDSFFGACHEANFTGDITTVVEKGTFDAFYGASYRGNVTGNISSTVKGGYFGAYYGGSLGEVAADSTTNHGYVDGTVTNTVEGGVFDAFYGASKGSYNVNENTTASIGMKASVTNTVSGGIFYGFWGGTQEYAAEFTLTGDITNTITGGAFYGSEAVVFAGGPRNGLHQGNVTTTIEGGSFAGIVVGGASPFDSSFAHDNEGFTKMTLSGGELAKTILADSYLGSYTEGATLSVELEEGRSLGFFGEASLDLIKGSGTIKIGPDTTLTIGDYNGEITFLQIGGWHNRDYVYLNKIVDITVQTAENAFGAPKIEGNVIRGEITDVVNVSFVFTDYIQVRLAIEASFVDDLVSDGVFCLAGMMNDRVIFSGDQSSLEKITTSDGGEYYSILSIPLRAAELNYDLELLINGETYQKKSLMALAAFGVDYYRGAPALSDLFKSVCNYAAAAGNYASNGQEIYHTDIPFEHERVPTNFTNSNGLLTREESAPVTFTSRSMVLGSGLAIRYYGTVAEKDYEDAASRLKVLVNSEPVDAPLEKVSVQNGIATVRVTIPVTVGSGSTALRIIMRDKNSDHYNEAEYNYVWLDRIERLDALSETLADLEGENNALSRDLGEELLYYIQSAVTYQKTLLNVTREKPSTFSAGFARVDVSPYTFQVATSGTSSGKEVLDPIQLTCLALWDGTETTLMFTMDVRQAADHLVTNLKSIVSRDTGVPEDHIFVTVTHNHSAPNVTSPGNSQVKRWYNECVFPVVSVAAKQAILDLAPVNAYVGETLSDPYTNYVRRYEDKNGWRSVNDGKGAVSGFIRYESEADKTLRVLYFEREDQKNILLVNWQGHAAHGVSAHDLITADFIRELRVGLEGTYSEEEKSLYGEKLSEDRFGQIRFMYYNGATGNLNFSPYNPSDSGAADNPFRVDKNSKNDHVQIGQSLAITVKNLLNGVSNGKIITPMKAIDTGKVEVNHFTYEGQVRAETKERYDAAVKCKEEQKASGKDWKEVVKATYDGEKFVSEYDVTNTIARYEWIRDNGPTRTIHLWTVTFGDMAFALAPFEMFDTTGQNIRAASDYEMTFACGYTNGYLKYMPTSIAYDHGVGGGYEVHASFFAKGTAEACESILKKSLVKNIFIKPTPGDGVIVGPIIPIF